MPKSTGVPITPRDFKEFEGRLELRCKVCGKKGKYKVGRIFLDPAAARLPPEERKGLREDDVCFTGYFHCRCGAGGPWEFTPTTHMQLLALLLVAIHNKEQADIHFVKNTMFDGTVIHCATEGEAHLKELIEANPTDYFLWSRLGNLYEQAGEDDLAFDAFRRAVELNPDDLESHYSLGCYQQERGQLDEAAGHFSQLLSRCHMVTHRNPALIRQLVRDVLERMLDLHNDSGGRIPFLPPLAGESTPEQLPPGSTSGRVALSLPRDWDVLVETYMTGRVPDSAKPLPKVPRFAPPEPGRVGRNDPCPCGSGRKFKRCCGRSH